MTEFSYEKHLIRKPAYESDDSIKGRQAPATYMSDKLVPGCPLHIDLSWVYDKPEPNSFDTEKVDNFDKIVLNISSNPYIPKIWELNLSITSETRTSQSIKVLLSMFPRVLNTDRSPGTGSAGLIWSLPSASRATLNPV